MGELASCNQSSLWVVLLLYSPPSPCGRPYGRAHFPHCGTAVLMSKSVVIVFPPVPSFPCGRPYGRAHSPHCGTAVLMSKSVVIVFPPVAILVGGHVVVVMLL